MKEKTVREVHSHRIFHSMETAPKDGSCLHLIGQFPNGNEFFIPGVRWKDDKWKSTYLGYEFPEDATIVAWASPTPFEIEMEEIGSKMLKDWYSRLN